MELVTWIMAHGTELLLALLALHGLAKAIVILTPTPRDDDLLSSFYKGIEFAALLIGKAKMVPPNKEEPKVQPKA